MKKILKSKGYKTMMAMLYGVGASIVILGALFKITHKPGADLMLTVGLVTEAIIFFFSAFEPPYVDPDWSIVYPDLAHQYHTKAQLKALGLDTTKVSRGKKPQKVTEELDNMLKNAKIESELIESLGTGLRKFSEKAAHLSDISDASIATNNYVNNINEATASASILVSAYKQSAESLTNSSEVTNDYLSNVKNASDAIVGLTDVYNETTERAKSDSEIYNNSLHSAANNLASLNTAYEMQLKNADDYMMNIKKASEAMFGLTETYNETSQRTKADSDNYNESLHAVQNNLALLNTTYETQMQNVEKMHSSIENFVESLNLSAKNTTELNQRVGNLNQKIAALNGVYGNMLSAFNVKSND